MRILFLGLATVFCVTSAFGWGCDGHQIIALMARQQLTPAASTAVDRLLTENPVSPALSRYCKNRSADAMADASTWADDVRDGENNGAWHYVDIPMSLRMPPSSPKTLDPWCPDTAGKEGSGCVSRAIDSQREILKDKTKPAAQRANALRYLIHFVGDIHQPLHDSDNNDQGGNCSSIRYLGEVKPTNLHSIWDTRLIQTDMERRHLNRADYAAQLGTEFATRRTKWSTEKIDPIAWAWEGHALAVKRTYGMLKPQIPAEKPGPTNCDATTAKVAALHIALGERYVSRALPPVREQLAHSASRLATLLNQTL